MIFRIYCLPKKFLPILTQNIQQYKRSMSPIQKINYPVVHKDNEVSEIFHGVEVKDVYRWLEDPDSHETQAFVESQNKISQPFIESGGIWEKIKTKLTKLWNYPKYSCVARHGTRYFHYRNTGLQNQNVLYQQDSLDGEAKVFLDPNNLSSDGTVALTISAFSDDGNYFAYGLSESGSDWVKIKIRSVEDQEDLPETLEKFKYSTIAWTKDNKGFFYGRFSEQIGKADGVETRLNENQKLFYHRLGEPQDNDILVVEFPHEPSWLMSAEVSDCGKYVILMVFKECRDNLVFFSDLTLQPEIKGKLKLNQIIHKFEADYEYITNTGSKVVFRTNKNAPNYRLIVIDLENPCEEKWTTLVAEHEKDVLDWCLCVDKDKLVLGYMHDVKSILHIHSLHTGDFIMNFPLDIGQIERFTGNKKYSEIFFNFVSFLSPGTIYYYDFSKQEKEPKILQEIKINLSGFKKEDYNVEQIFYKSKDNTEIPMFIIRKKKEFFEERPCLLYGYGGFNVSLQPSFSLTAIMFMDTFDGVVAYPNLRGGGEYGEKWHNSGRLHNKQNGFDDFHCAAEYLIEKGYTNKNKLVIQGGSNGGLLVAACINQRPDLFGAAVVQVGVLDMLRYHKFTIGHTWISDYGDPADKDHFTNLYRYSPLHNVHTPKNEKEEYPATLILTADHDDRVSPLHSLKFTATIQDAVRNSEYQKKPLLLRVYEKAGHGAGKPTTKKIEESADILTFAAKTLDVDVVNV